jgi:tetratricopeptide (TPR) repeat protein/predicted aspartyl protease
VRRITGKLTVCIFVLAAAGILVQPMAAFGKCTIAKLVEIPVTMVGLRPVITVKINDRDAQFVLDSGAFYSMMSAAMAAEFNLKLSPSPYGLRVSGIGGSVDTSMATVKVFNFAGITVHDVPFLVGGSEVGGAAGSGLLGQNLLSHWDDEYDFARGVVKLFRVEDCKNAMLAYWRAPGQSVSILDIDLPDRVNPHTSGVAYVNGSKIRVEFDTGAWTSTLSIRAAERAGVKVDSPGVVSAGYQGGIGRVRSREYIGAFASFKIGDDEEIKNTHLRIGEVGLIGADMLIGADFFVSHHVFVSNSQHKLYLTYNGGAVFNLANAPPSAAPSVAGTPDAPNAPAGQGEDAPADAASLARRGSAFAARHDFEHAIADLTRACELEPNNPEYFLERGMAYRDSGMTDLAAADFDRTLELKSDDLSALEARAQLRLAQKNVAGAVADLDSADRAAPKEANLRLFLARAYQSADNLAAAIAQFDLWISAHAADSHLAEALNGRCWVRAQQGRDLAKALSDCNDALRMAAKPSPFSAAVLNVRGFVRLRLGDYDKSIADYDASLKVNPKNAWALYGRGVAKTRRKSGSGDADMTAATALWAPISDAFEHRGILP